MFKAGIFDVDGVLVDTVPLHFKAWQKMFSEYGIEFSFEDYKAKVDGIPRIDGARAILPESEASKLEAAAARKQTYFLELVEKEEIIKYDSSINLVKELKGYSIKIAFASSSKNCKTILKKTGIIDLADAVIDGNDITRGKPDPQIFQIAAKRLNVSYKECVVFEDAVLGVEAAINGEMICIGVDRYNNHSRLAKANLVVSDLSEVNLQKLEGLFRR